ncbi:MAG: hypothetical protein FJ304_06530 [Planctomycetes bacterium]|nr:hypothetical protein [Planctomycetota bacterium]
MKTLLFALGALALVGCNTFKPVGPLAKQVPITQQGQPIPNAPADAPKPPPVRPTPPSLLVTPADVTAENPYAAATKLASELTADGKAAANVPVTVEVSHVKKK